MRRPGSCACLYIPSRSGRASRRRPNPRRQHMADGLPMTEHGRDRVIYDMYAHPLDDDWQRRRSPFWELDKIDIPVLSIGAWGKAALHLRGNFMGYERVSGPKQLLVTGAASFAETQRLFADADFHREELLPWYDRHLKGVDNAVMGRPAVRFFVQGEDKVREAADWPPPDATPVAFYLSGEKCGHIQSLNDGSLVETRRAATAARHLGVIPTPSGWRASPPSIARACSTTSRAW